MRSRVLEAYNAINLLKNGGLAMDAVSGEAPPFWDVTGAVLSGLPTENRYSIVNGQTPDSKNACANYFDVSLASDDAVTLEYDFYYRFQTESAGKATPPWIQDTPDKDPEYEVTEAHLIRGSDITVAFGAKAVAGAVEVVTRFESWPADQTYTDVVMYDALASRDWVRPTVVHSLGAGRLTKLIIKVRRVPLSNVSQFTTARVLLGNFALANGGHSWLPFTGDLMAEAIPKGAVIFAVGKYCPPGFEKLSFTAPPKAGRLFPRGGGGSLDEGGSESHNHTESTMAMDPQIDWPTIALQREGPRDDPTPSEDGDSVHTHPLGEAFHVPPSKDVILCRRQ